MTFDDAALLREYARNNSSEAFSELVNRHIHLVYSVALRQARDHHLAEEITQVVFIILARKAHSLGPKTILPGWLCRTARYASANALKIHNRRQRYEHEAQQESSMQSTATETESETWREIAPLLDDALGTLGEKEHNAIVLRFLEGKDFRQVAATLNTGEDAARMRVNRGLEKLRKFFSKRGVVSTTAIIAGEISANGVHAAPTGLAGSVASTAIAKGAATGAATMALTSRTLKTMTCAKVKFASGVAVTVLLAAGLAGMGIAVFPQSMQDDRNDRYQLEGTLVYDTSVSGFTCGFTVTVNGPNSAIHLTNKKWKMKHEINWSEFGLKNPPPSTGPFPLSPSAYDEDVCLNGTIYYYGYIGQPPAGDPAKNSGGATIYYGDSPVDDGSSANWVWVGLASGHYFSKATNEEVTPLGNNGDVGRAMGIRVKAQWQLNDAPPWLPKSIVYYENPIQGILTSPGVVNHQFDNGWKSGEVRVLQETNFNGRVFPTKYTYEQFSPNLDNPTNLKHQCLVTVTVQKVSLHSVPDVRPPKTDGETFVNDYRLSVTLHPRTGNKTPFHFTYGAMYTTTAKRLPEKPDAAGIKAYKEQLRRLHMPYTPPPTGSPVSTN